MDGAATSNARRPAHRIRPAVSRTPHAGADGLNFMCAVNLLAVF